MVVTISTQAGEKGWKRGQGGGELGRVVEGEVGPQEEPLILGKYKDTHVLMAENQEPSLFLASRELVGETLKKGPQGSQKH